MTKRSPLLPRHGVRRRGRVAGQLGRGLACAGVLLVASLVGAGAGAEGPPSGSPLQWLDAFLDAAGDERTYSLDPEASVRPLGAALAANVPCLRSFVLAPEHPGFVAGVRGALVGPVDGCPRKRGTVLLSFYVRADRDFPERAAERVSGRLGMQPRRLEEASSTTLHWQRTKASAVQIVTSPELGNAGLAVFTIVWASRETADWAGDFYQKDQPPGR